MCTTRTRPVQNTPNVYRTPTSVNNTCTTRTRRVRDTPNCMQHTPICVPYTHKCVQHVYNTDTTSARHTQPYAAHPDCMPYTHTYVQHGHDKCKTHPTECSTHSTTHTSVHNTCTTRTRRVHDTPGRRAHHKCVQHVCTHECVQHVYNTNTTSAGHTWQENLSARPSIVSEPSSVYLRTRPAC